MDNNVTRARQTLHTVLREIGWADGDHAPAGGYRIGFDALDPVSEIVLGIDAPAQVFMLLADFTVAAPPDCVQRTNWSLVLGSLELDPASGALRFRLAIPFAGGELAATTLRQAILVAMQAVESCVDDLAAVEEAAA